MRGELNNDERMNALFAAHFEAVRAYCLRRLPVGDANDAVAEVFMTVWRKIDDVPPEPATRPWLYGIARNKVAHARRGFSRRVRLGQRVGALAPATTDGPETVVLSQAENDSLIEALEGLKAADREVLMLRAWEELTAPEIARTLGISVAAAEKRITRATNRLAAAMKGGTFTGLRPHASEEGGGR